MTKTKIAATVLLPLILFCAWNASASGGYDPQKNSFIPDDGYVPTKEMAISIAEIVLDKIYGKAVIDGEKPLTVVLKDDIWIIDGTLNCPRHFGKHMTCLGGTAHIEISKKTGEILRVIHSE